MCKSKNEVAKNFLICLRNFIKTTKLQQSAKCLVNASDSQCDCNYDCNCDCYCETAKGATELKELAKQNTVKRNLQLNLAIAFLALLPPIQLDSICVPATDSYTYVSSNVCVCVCVCAWPAHLTLPLCVFKWQCKWQHFGEHFTLCHWQLHDIFFGKLFVLNLIAMKISIHLQWQLVKVHWQLRFGACSTALSGSAAPCQAKSCNSDRCVCACVFVYEIVSLINWPKFI